MTNIILCGGNGTRLWPISRTLMPKQFIKLFNKKSLFQSTVKRNSTLCNTRLIISNTEQYFLAMDQLQELNEMQNQCILEPIGKDSAPAIALACFALHQDDLVFVTPADHLIKDQQAYEETVKQAQHLAKEDYLVTFGIKPSFPHTGFGYIQANGFDVMAFHEKPNYNTAIHYIQSKDYYWNSGMFMFKVRVFLEELKKYSPDIYEASFKAYHNASS